MSVDARSARSSMTSTRSRRSVAPVAARYQGEEAVPNPANPMVGLRFTGKPCDAVVRVDDSGAARVESSFVPGRAVGLTPVADTFYLGELHRPR